MSDENKKPQTVPQTVPEMEAEMKKLEFEAKRLEIEERKSRIARDQADLEDIHERLAERKLARDKKKQTSISNGQVLKQNDIAEQQSQARCNHHKGGNGMEGYKGGQGDSPQYAVLKHIFANGDMWIRCMRCGKTWKPPIKSDFESDAAYQAAVGLYREAKQFNTKNATSSAYIFQYSDGGEYYREVTRSSTLR